MNGGNSSSSNDGGGAWQTAKARKHAKTQQPASSPASQASAKDRLTFTLCCLVGKKVHVKKLDGTVIEGVLVGGNTEPSFKGCSLRYARIVEPKSDDVMKEINITWQDTAYIFSLDSGGMIKDIEMAKNGGRPAAKGGFRTDTDISTQAVGAKKTSRLQAADSSWLDTTGGPNKVNLSMDAGDGSWDQFKVNEEKFGVKSSFDENLYTTSLDKQKLSRADIRRAENLARSIEGQKSTNFHLNEERGHKDAYEGDEESRYSSVVRTDSQGGYVPPHRRPPPGAAKPAPAAEVKGKPSAPKGNKEKAQAAPEKKKKSPTAASNTSATAATTTAAPEKPATMSWAARVKGPQAPAAQSPEASSTKQEASTTNSKPKAQQTVEKTESKSDKPKVAPPPPSQKQKKESSSIKKEGGNKPATSTAAGVATTSASKEEQPTTPKSKPVVSKDRQKQIDEMKQFSQQIKSKKTKAEGAPGPAGENTEDDAKAKSKLNTNAKEWTPNANAKTFTPNVPAAPPSNPVAQQQQPPMPPNMQPPAGAPPVYVQQGFVPPAYGYPVPQMMYPVHMPPPAMFGGPGFAPPAVPFYPPVAPNMPPGAEIPEIQQQMQQQPPPPQQQQQQQHPPAQQ